MDNEEQYSLNLRTPDQLIIDITSRSMATTWGRMDRYPWNIFYCIWY